MLRYILPGIILATTAHAHDAPTQAQFEKIKAALEQIGCTASPDDVAEHEGSFELIGAACDDGAYLIEMNGAFEITKKLKL